MNLSSVCLGDKPQRPEFYITHAEKGSFKKLVSPETRRGYHLGKQTNVMSCCTGDRHAPCVPLCHGCQGHGTTLEPNSLNWGGGRGSSRKRFLTVGRHRLTAEMMGFHSPWEALFSLLGKRGTGMHKLPQEAAQPIISPLSMCCKVWAWWHMSQKIQFSQNTSIQMASPLQCQSWWEANSIQRKKRETKKKQKKPQKPKRRSSVLIRNWDVCICRAAPPYTCSPVKGWRRRGPPYFQSLFEYQTPKKSVWKWLHRGAQALLWQALSPSA